MKNISLFHLSETKLTNRILKPRIPNNNLTRMGVENNTIPRISVAPSIDHALTGYFYNYKNNHKMHVYNVKNGVVCNVAYPPKEYVPDIQFTKEMWVLEPVEMVYSGCIEVIGTQGKPLHWSYTICRRDSINSTEIKQITETSYRWKWQWVK